MDKKWCFRKDVTIIYNLIRFLHKLNDSLKAGSFNVMFQGASKVCFGGV